MIKRNAKKIVNNVIKEDKKIEIKRKIIIFKLFKSIRLR